ncbi:MAG: hypothetical protein JO353_10170 [Phycisphaerae bacterium]|nr:hypothetical protein [Phycisphaerae bacterium]
MRWAVPISLLFIAAGCITHMQNPATTQPVTFQDLSTTQPTFWLQQPAAASVSSPSFDRLWSAAEQVARNYLFSLDRQDYRQGVLTTVPLVSAQWFEPWRRDLNTLHDYEESNLASIRRTIRVDFVNNQDGTFTATPRVIVERKTMAEIRITAITSYRSVFVPAAKARDQQVGTTESDLGVQLPRQYWYALGRDQNFERVIADKMEQQLKQR